MRVLVTGMSGFFGPFLKDEFQNIDENTVLMTARTGTVLDCDLRYIDDVHKMMGLAKPDLVVHAAASTNVDWCQSNPVASWDNNVVATSNIVQAMPKGCRLVYISTDMVYSGPGWHHVDRDTENPLNVYGMTKYMGEAEAAKSENALIVRTNMYGVAKGLKKSSSLVDFLLGSFQQKKPINIFTDVHFTPLYIKTLAREIRRFTEKGINGTVNLSSATSVSKAGFAMLLAAKLGLRIDCATPTETPDIPGRAPRPKDTRMVPDDKMNSIILSRDMDLMCEEIRCGRV